MKKNEICPVCGEADKTLKISQIYMESLAKGNLLEDKQKKNLRDILGTDPGAALPGRVSADLMKTFSPPSGKSIIIRQVHPDQAMGVLMLISLFFLYNIYYQQYQVFMTSIVIFVLLMVGYVVFRKAIMKKYLKSKNDAAQANERVKRSRYRLNYQN
jgi:predicted membrane protein